ncbi:hypothetical protein [Metasolibacillus meyeri]|uniref:hypothetical protein n=1 Tax=Metasolibacillus meyeri TaxID=1071052 RepID=UPI000D2FB545|nr:hypothetical protein [Metasolibacillus meyeri]
MFYYVMVFSVTIICLQAKFAKVGHFKRCLVFTVIYFIGMQPVLNSKINMVIMMNFFVVMVTMLTVSYFKRNSFT